MKKRSVTTFPLIFLSMSSSLIITTEDQMSHQWKVFFPCRHIKADCLSLTTAPRLILQTFTSVSTTELLRLDLNPGFISHPHNNTFCLEIRTWCLLFSLQVGGGPSVNTQGAELRSRLVEQTQDVSVLTEPNMALITWTTMKLLINCLTSESESFNRNKQHHNHE